MTTTPDGGDLYVETGWRLALFSPDDLHHQPIRSIAILVPAHLGGKAWTAHVDDGHALIHTGDCEHDPISGGTHCIFTDDGEST